MKIKTLKTVEEEMEIQVPCFYKHPYCDIYYKIMEDYIVKAYDNAVIIVSTDSVNEIIRESKVTQEEIFNEKLLDAIERIKEMAAISEIPTLQNVMP